ncbi:hypothetical protein C6P45_000033 [Maudiozyma exigua]|uniref:AMP-activated protein kinase glycogen-binding domain-containing protein n=1 Tax=Maudiozyma exigua TaxID=34358 RepID=A0A9P7BDE5_MAUEX|nr:hypothetical protein C6P45_000033 [Kazachstania exigua]
MGVEILIPDKNETFKKLQIAGDFTNWEIEPMRKVSQSTEIAGSSGWQFIITNEMAEKYCNKESADETMIHFKFIGDDGNWFTSDDFDLVPDENNNINNAVLLKFENGKLKEENIDDVVSDVVEPAAQDLTPDPSLEKTSEQQQQKDPIEINNNTDDDDDDDTALDTISEEQKQTPDPVKAIPQTPIKSERVDSPIGDETIFFSPSVISSKGQDVTEDEDEAETPITERRNLNTTNSEEILGAQEVAEKKDPNVYKGMLQRLIDFLSAFFGSWFGFFTKKHNSDN